jgi:membrane protease YdiL (CAAX protease family)
MSPPVAPAAPPVPPGWYRDPWRIAPMRWWDGGSWTPAIFGPYGMALPLSMIAPEPFVPRGPGIKGGGIAAAGAGFALAANVVVAIVWLAANGGGPITNSLGLLVAGQLALWACFIGATVVAARVNGTKSLVKDYGLSWPKLSDAGIGFAAGIVGRLWPLLIAVLVILASGQGFGSSNSASPEIIGYSPHGAFAWTIIVLFAVVFAPIVEELFFRGLVQGAFSRRLGPIPALFLTALIFSVVHITDEGLLAPIVLFPMALLLGYLKHRTGRLAAGMVAHATFNASLFLLFVVPALR